ncbi:MAG: NAD(P)/FAD-dependent oxidoreductase [Planctomycetota bacterium]
MPSTYHDAIVVGAGPAGSTLALRLARAGRTVLLVDGATFPRDKVCGEGIMPAGVAVLEELGLRAVASEFGQPFHGIRYRLPDGTTAAAEFPDGLTGLGIQRRLLDGQLVRAAGREPNVDLRLGTWVRELELPRPGTLGRVVLDDEVVEAPVVVGADGGRSFVRRTAGLDPQLPQNGRFGVGLHFEHAPLDEGAPLVEVFAAADHELYTTPVAPDVTGAALLVRRAELSRYQGRLEEALRERLRAAGPRGEVLAASPALGKAKALGPLGLSARRAHAEGLLLVGDAAGALDPITGEGISLALTTSGLAADVLLEAFGHNDFSARRLAAWTRRRAKKVRALAGLTQVVLSLSEHPRVASRVVRNLARSPETFSRLLGVAAGMHPLSSLRVRDGVRLLLGV